MIKGIKKKTIGKFFLRLILTQCVFIGGAYADSFTEKAKQIVVNASNAKQVWTGPTEGPKAQAKKKIILVTSDLKNGGVVGVVKGVEEASQVIDWQVEVLNGGGSVKTQVAILNQAVAKKPDVIALIGWNPNVAVQPLKKASSLGIVLVSWHATTSPGAVPKYNIFFDVGTDPNRVSEVAAMYAVAKSNGTAKAVIFTDSLYAIALSKARAMEKIIQSCKKCEVLELIDTPISDTSARMPQMTFTLLKKYGDKLEYMLAINDLYFAFTGPSLRTAGKNRLGPPYNIGAGDGSEAAYQRIRSGQYQSVTVPEPLNLQGWQIVDEANRALSDAPPSGYIAPVYLVTKGNVDANGGDRNVYDPQNGYRNIYRKIWGK